MGGKEAEAADFGGNVFANGPGQAEPVVSRRAYTRVAGVSDVYRSLFRSVDPPRPNSSIMTSESFVAVWTAHNLSAGDDIHSLERKIVAHLEDGRCLQHLCHECGHTL